MPSIEPDPTSFMQVIAAIPSGVPVTMLNLLRFRELAAYQADDADLTALPACSGREAYLERYGPASFEHVTRVGGELVWAGHAAGSLIAPPDEHWDDVLLVRYPSIEAFMTMVGDPDYLACARHRTAALADSRLIATAS